VTGSTPYSTIALLSDLGRADESVGVLHAIARDIAAHAAVIDVTHDIAVDDVRAGSLALARATAYLPGEVIVVAAVDCESQRLVAVQVAGGRGVLIGPDNGLLAPGVAVAGGADRAIVLSNTDYHLDSPGAVFAVRDVLMPAAAHLCNGVPLDALGMPIDPAVLLPGTVPIPRHDAESSGLICEVMSVNRRGDVQLNASPDDLAGWVASTVSVETPASERGGRVAHVVKRTGDLRPGAIGIIVDAHGMCALVANRRSAAEEMGVVVGDMVILAPGDDDVPSVVSTPVTFTR
jgi:S-adenosyl-L-methionine hydrolase (adenosine-forming)